MAIINTLKSLISLSITNTSIALATAILEQVLNNVVFKCPCITDINFIYGIVFLVFPAIVLFVLGYVLNPKTWKFFTGCCCKRKSARNERSCTLSCCNQKGAMKKCCLTFFVILFRALVAPLSWISIGLFDGEYYACAVTKQPYNQSCEVVNRGTEAIINSAEYHKQMAVSRLIGWFTVAGSFTFGALVYTCWRCCCLKLEHWHYEKSKWEETIHEDIFQKLVKEEIEEKGKVEFRKCLEDKNPEAIFEFLYKEMTHEEKNFNAEEMETTPLVGLKTDVPHYTSR